MDQVHKKISTDHLRRKAYLYVRQSSLKQVYNNKESTERQYALRQRAIRLGWSVEDVIVIDQDQGQSGAATNREGFQKLVSEVGMGHAGIVMGLEVSRLARNNTEWHRLLEICALTNTLILDEEGIYDPKFFNDRLLLGLKGSISEAELHVIKARLQGGILNKAQKGELKVRLPTGLVYDCKDKVVLDPDKRIRKVFEFIFETFCRVGSARGVVKTFQEQEVKIPRRICSGVKKGEIVWVEAEDGRIRSILRNPRFAGVYCYGRKKTSKNVEGKYSTVSLPREEWSSFIRDAHEGYISFDEYERNLQRLLENSQARGDERKKSPPREGPALLQGIVMCGICGNRMTVRYHSRKKGLIPSYVCQEASIRKGKKVCQNIVGFGLDEAIGQLLIEIINPMTLEIALAVQQEIQSRLEEVDLIRRQKVEQARYEADLARRRYMEVDPSHRLVADTLEAEWNQKLRDLADAQEEYTKKSHEDKLLFDDEQKKQILSSLAL